MMTTAQCGSWNTAPILLPALSAPGTAKFSGPLGHIPGMVWIPEGPCTIGSNVLDDAQPIRQPHIDGFYAAQTMGTNQLFDAFVAAQPDVNFVLTGHTADGSVVALGEERTIARANILLGMHLDKLGSGALVGLELVRRTAITRPEWTMQPKFRGPRKPAFGMNQIEAGACAAWIGTQLRLPAGWICRLPTEFEAEKAGRGPQGLDHGSDDGTVDPSKGCYNAEGPVNVAQYRPNGYGLYDAMGLGWEWTDTWYDPKYYQGMPARNPRGPVTGTTKVLRGGGSWPGNDAESLLVARRLHSLRGPADDRSDVLGFRVVVAPKNSSIA